MTLSYLPHSNLQFNVSFFQPPSKATTEGRLVLLEENLFYDQTILYSPRTGSVRSSKISDVNYILWI